MVNNLLHLLVIISMLAGPLAGVGSQSQQQSDSQWVIYNTLDYPQLPEGLEVIEDYGSFVLGRMPANQITADAPGLEVLRERTQVTINNTRFDSRLGEPPIADILRSPAGDPYYLVQFIGPIKTEWVEGLQSLGVEILGYHPNYTYIVRMSPETAQLAGQIRVVQWIGQYHPAYRLPADEDLPKAEVMEGRYGLNVRFFEGVDLPAAQQAISALGVNIEWLSGQQARAWALPEQIAALAAIPGVYRVEAYDMPQLTNEKAVQVTHTFDVWDSARNRLGVDLMGAGQIAGMVDSGLDDNDTSPLHLDFYDYTNNTSTTRITSASNGAGCGLNRCTCYTEDHYNSSGHGTHVAGSIVGNGYLSLLQQGLQAQARAADPSFDYAFGVGQAPEAQIAFANVAGAVKVGPSTYEGTLCGIGDEVVTWTNVYNQGARNANNSWGDGYTNYNTSSVAADQVMWTYQDYLLVTSASNSGPGWITVGNPGTAKNILTVGAAGNHRPAWNFTSSTASLLTDFSSRGPVSGDGRFKPDIVAPGADILSTRSTFIANNLVPLWGNEPGDGDGNGVQDYTWSGGTSMSSPLVTGAATIVRDYLQDIQGLGNTTPPSAALVKGFLLNGAVDMGYGYEAVTSAPYGGRNLQGWGMANLEQSIAPRAPRSFFYDDFTNITNLAHQSTIGIDTTGDYVQYTVTVANSSEPLKITLNWTDPQNGSQGAFVNNLDLLVTAPNTTQYKGNVFSGSWSTSGGSADTINNTEAVYIQNPAAGSWTIRVTATAWASGTQPFALVASGGFGVTPSTTRTCSGIASCTGRMGTSARANYPTLVQLSGTQEHTAPGSAFTTNLRLTNWGTSSDTYTLSAAYTDMNGAAASGISVTFNPAGPLTLASGASQDVQVTVIVGTAVPSGAYDAAITATSGGNSAVKDAQVIALNVIPSTSLYNEQRVISDSGAQFSPDLWASGQNVWAAYVSAESHNNDEAEIFAACSADGGATWSKSQIDSTTDGTTYYAKPNISGNADGSSVTVAWMPINSTAIYARTWTRTSGCSGTWGDIRTLANYTNYYIDDLDVIYDNDTAPDSDDILVTWLEVALDTDGYVISHLHGIYYALSTDNGASFLPKDRVPAASLAASGTSILHRWPSMTLDSTNNAVWMAFNYRAVSGVNWDVRLTRFNGATNAWDAGNIAVSSHADREIHPGIAIINGYVWVAWNRYVDYTNPTARIYYARSNAALPTTPAFSTTYGPYATRVSEGAIPQISGDATTVYIAYLAISDGLRGTNLQALQIPGAGGAPSATLQLSATVDDPPFSASGNAGAPRMAWAQTTVNGQTVSGPVVLYAKNPPNSGSPDYSTNLGVLQTLFNLEENVDLYLLQFAPPVITDTYADTAGLCALNEPCYITFQGAVNDVNTNGSTHAYASLYNEALTINKTITANVLGSITLASLTQSAGTFNAPAATLTLTGNLAHTGGTFNPNSGTLAFTGTGVQNITGNTNLHNVYVGANSVVTTADIIGRSGTLTNLGWTDETRSVSATGSYAYGLAGVSVNVTTRGTLSSLQVRRRDTNHPSATTGIQTGKYWQINPTGAGYTADLTLEHSGLDDPKACRYASGWDCARDSFTASGVTRLGLTAFSEWAVGNQVGPTAVTLNRLGASPASGPLPWLAGAAGLLLLGALILLRRK